MLMLLAQEVESIEQIQAFTEFAKMGVGVIAMVIAFGFVLVTLANSRSNNKMTASLVGVVGSAFTRTDKLEERFDEQEKQTKVYNEAIMNTLNTSVATLNQLVQQQSKLFSEVLGMRSDNALILELKEQIVALQATTRQQAVQLEEQALEITTLRESNVSLMNNLMVERETKAQLELQLKGERDRNAKEVQMLKDQFHKLQAEFIKYKQAGKPNKEATLKNDLPQHPEQPNTTDQ